MRTGLGQINAVVGDLKGNADKMRGIYERAVSEGVDLLVFGELGICGYPPEDLLYKGHFIEDMRREVEKLAKDCREKTLVVGFAEVEGGRLYNSAAVLRGGKMEAIYRKGLLPNYGVFDEKRYFRSGDKPVVIEVEGIRVAITICRDIWEPEWLRGFLKGSGRIDAIVNLSASPFYAGKIEQREEVIRECARSSGRPVCYCNIVGGQDELVFDGRSMFVDGDGELLVRGRSFEEDFLIGDITKGGCGDVGLEVEEGVAGVREGRLEDVYKALVLGTRDYVRKNGFSGVLFGLSGGIDSSVTGALAVEALGAENVTGVSMPTRFSSSETRRDAAKLAKNLGIGFYELEIESVLGEFDKSLGRVEGWDNEGVAYENLQARIRGCVLMSLSNQLGKLVLTTGNKSETAVGYCTLYGDTAGGFSVIKDVPKTMVYKLAEYVNKISGCEVIGREIIRRAPSAELRAGQRDSDSLPAYEVLDRILEGYVEKDKSVQELIESGLPSEEVCRVVRMVDRNEYKRRLSPPGVKISPKAFGRDRRLPITNGYEACREQ